MEVIKRNITIREGRPEDAARILEVQKRVIDERIYLITAPEEFNQTKEETKSWIQKIEQNKRETLFIAEYKETIVGWLVFQTNNRKRLQHTGSLGMMIAEGYRNIGVGKRLIQELLAWAVESPGIEKVCLGVFR
ncbi:GNAT family N-acetyltransferase [Halobacillus massiliensis]|uniref:GNAT family N-acetyltransferase n=1 Tax=Halobacillus massiliensis TaxID=1926286 RepID=UPI0015C4B322|nr:GNAT family N-acetyltransferase [Halobacillus massiliensis]